MIQIIKLNRNIKERILEYNVTFNYHQNKIISIKKKDVQTEILRLSGKSDRFNYHENNIVSIKKACSNRNIINFRRIWLFSFFPLWINPQSLPQKFRSVIIERRKNKIMPIKSDLHCPKRQSFISSNHTGLPYAEKKPPSIFWRGWLWSNTK